jgi:ABC-type branched-subunit amino acid transport system substrate-binding protein
MIVRPAARLLTVAVAAAALATTAACGSSTTGASGSPSSSGSSSSSGSQPGGASNAKVDPQTGIINAKYCKNTTEGVTSDTITFGISHPESGPQAVTGKAALGIKAYFDYLNDTKGGVRGHKLKLIMKDDAGQPARTVQNVNEMLGKDHVFGFILNQGTPTNLAIRDRLDAQCVPNLLISTGSSLLTAPVKHPFTLVANATYAAEVNAFVDYLAKNQPGAKIATISENSDFGKSYRDPMEKAVKGKNVSLVTQQTYEPTDPNVTQQFTAIRSSGATALFIGAAALKCPQSIDAAAGQYKTVYMSANCTSKAIIGLAKPQFSEGVISESALLDPTNPANASNEQMKFYFETMKKYAPDADASLSSVSYGFTEAAILTEILNAAPKLDRVDVMNKAHNFSTSGVGLLQPGITWKTSGPSDPFPVESFRLETWDSAKQVFTPMSEVISYEGRSADLVS